jgi:hypothetical protein
MKIALKFGILLSLTTLLWLSFEYVAGFHTTLINYHPIVTNFIIIPAILIFRRAFIAIKNSSPQQLSFRSYFIEGLKLSLVIILLTPLEQYIFHHYINPEFFHAMIENTVAGNHASRAQAEAYFNFNNYVTEALMGTVFMGILFSGIGAWRMSKNNS